MQISGVDSHWSQENITVSAEFLARRAREVAIAEEGGGNETTLENMSTHNSACTKANDDHALVTPVDEELGTCTNNSVDDEEVKGYNRLAQ